MNNADMEYGPGGKLQKRTKTKQTEVRKVLEKMDQRRELLTQEYLEARLADLKLPEE